MPSYVEQDFVKTINNISGTGRDDLIDELIPIVSGWIDAFCHRTFEAVTATHYYDWSGATRLWFRDDLYSLTTLTNGDGATLTAGTDFYLKPYGGPPYSYLDILPSGSALTYETTPMKALAVAGQWGYSAAAPDVIKLATAQWVGWLLSTAATAGVQSMSMAGYSVSFKSETNGPGEPPANVRQALAPYVRRRIFGSR